MFNLSEDTLNALYQRLQNNLPAKITEVNATLNNPSFPLDPVLSTSIFDFIPTTAVLTTFPAVAISDGPIDFKDDIGWSATAEMDFAVVIWVQEFEQRALAWKLRRMMVAVANVIMEGRSLVGEGGGWGVTLGSVEPGPVLGRKENPKQVLGMRAMSFQVRDEQDA